MKIRTKLPLFTSVTVLVSILAIAVYSIVDFRSKTLESIESYRTEQTELVQEQLKDNINSAYAMIDEAYNFAVSSGMHMTESGEVSKSIVHSQFLSITKENIRKFRFGKAGYIWINEYEKPYTVIMHPIKAEYENNPGEFILPESGQNVYEAFAEKIREGGGEGFLEYRFYKSAGSSEMYTKMGFFKLYPPLGWVIGTGVYIDHIDEMVAKKQEELYTQIDKTIWFISVFGIALIIVASIILFYVVKEVTDAIYKVREQLYDMSLGRVVRKTDEKRTDEIGDMRNSLNDLIAGVGAYSDFALSIGEGDLNADFEPLSEEDNLGNSLIKMRDSLLKARTEEEIRAIENEKRNWANEGYTMFSEIMRKSSEDIYEMSYEIISNLVKYLKANQGGLFIVNEDENEQTNIDLIASIAYDRRKFNKKSILPGEGLVGACALEKQKIFITNVPDNYIEIRSGLGTSNPRCVLIVPLLMEGKLIGIMEIASFHVLDIHEVEFVEKVSENIAASLYASKVSIQTAKIGSNAEMYEKQKNELQEKINELEKELRNSKRKLREKELNQSVLTFNK